MRRESFERTLRRGCEFLPGLGKSADFLHNRSQHQVVSRVWFGFCNFNRTEERPSLSNASFQETVWSIVMSGRPMIIGKLLWLDGLAGAFAGAAVLLAGSWLSDWYQLPEALLRLIGAANLAYGTYSLSLAMRSVRPKSFILFLIIANFFWVGTCLWLAVAFVETASLFGLAHLVGEAAFVGGLATLEWRFRERLRMA
jgi:hypothetical protein